MDAIVELIKALAELFKELAPFIALGTGFFAYLKSRENKRNSDKHKQRTDVLEHKQSDLEKQIGAWQASFGILEDSNKILQDNFRASNDRNKELTEELRTQEIGHQIDLDQYKDLFNAATRDAEKAERQRKSDRLELEGLLTKSQHERDVDTVQFRKLIDGLGEAQRADALEIKSLKEALRKANEWNSALDETIKQRDATITQERQEAEIKAREFEDQMTRVLGFNKSLRESLFITSQAKTAQEYRIAELLERVDKLEHPPEPPPVNLHADVEEVVLATPGYGAR